MGREFCALRKLWQQLIEYTEMLQDEPLVLLLGHVVLSEGGSLLEYAVFSSVLGEMK